MATKALTMVSTFNCLPFLNTKLPLWIFKIYNAHSIVSMYALLINKDKNKVCSGKDYQICKNIFNLVIVWGMGPSLRVPGTTYYN